MKLKCVILIIAAIIFSFSFSLTASALTKTQAVEAFLSNMITEIYAENTDFTAAQINAEIRRTVRAVERTGILENVIIEDGVIEFDWLTLFYITDWFFKEKVIELSFMHDDNGFYENSELGYGYVFVRADFKVEFPRIDEMCLIIAAIENNIVDWNPVIRASTDGITEIGGFAVAEIRRLLNSIGAYPPEKGELPDVTLAETHELLLVILGGVGFIGGVVLFRQLRK
jgi:hypothetical protein